MIYYTSLILVNLGKSVLILVIYLLYCDYYGFYLIKKDVFWTKQWISNKKHNGFIIRNYGNFEHVIPSGRLT